MNMNKTSPTSVDTEGTPCDKEQHSLSMDRAISLIGDRWTLFIVYNLLSGPKRFGELLTMGNVSPKTVSQRLKMLEKIGFVERHAFAEIPPRVEYHLTEKGQALVDILQAIGQFGERYLADEEVPPPCPDL
jgi:DNA-binding HxlR family transcriptional regulator